MLEAGVKAPDFKLQDQNGNEVALSDFEGKNALEIDEPLEYKRYCIQCVIGDIVKYYMANFFV